MDKKEKLKFVSIFIFLNFMFSSFISLFYLFISKHSFLEYLFLPFALFSNTFIIYIPIILVSFLLIFLPLVYLIFIFSFVNLYLIVDLVLYKFWDFHINSMVINLLLTPGGIETLNQSWNVKAFFFALVGLLFAFEIFIYRFAKKVSLKKYDFKSFFKKTILLLFVFVLVDKLGFALFSLYDFTDIIKNRDLFPLYQPLSIRSFANKYLGFKLEKVYDNIDTSKANFDYPKKEIKFKNPKNKYNIVILVVDSMRYDMFDKDITPYLWDFSKKAVVFKNHYSGGNCTRFGIFSIIYGIYGNYWFNALSNRKGPVLIDVLKKRGYDMRIIASSKLTFPEFTKTCFINVEREKILDNPPQGNGAVRDMDSVNKAADYIKNRDKKTPYFMFVFFDASHGSFDYTPEFEKFKPSYGVNLLTLNKENILPLFNKYKNSIHFSDWLINEIISSIKKSGDLENTIIIVTGDHGEAFLEKGYTGHNHSYSKEEVSVPLIFYHPGIKPSVIDYNTSHFDLVPTLLTILGVENEYSDYSQGFNLFENKERDYMAAFSWSDAGLIFKDYTMVVPTSSYGGRLKFYRNADWKEVGKDNSLIPVLAEFKRELTRFIKK
ncbi:MAG: sulfatase-like hydrolase/transferase [Elusimicrobiales bacterium]|nr:sulfatase-like hydrolase/transferase [Elusimicrobiales bacterium]HOL63184.1 sulfatase-like hydrolase/transferase [Elusimicrobiales bacterium]HPO95658.1 sulfatase-like hydrolase/transferase [Elusimicrobiales bacterium]